MSLSVADAHGLNFVFTTDGDPKIPTSFVQTDEMLVLLKAYVSRNLAKHDAHHFLDVDTITHEVFELWLENDVIKSKDTPINGVYLQFDQKQFGHFRVSYLNESDIHKLAKEIGGRYYPDTFARLAADITEGKLDSDPSDEESFDDEIYLPEEFPPHASEILATSEGREKFVSLVEKALIEVESAQLTNDQKAQARSYLLAAKNLTDQAEPPVDLIWRIISRASDLAGIASFFLSLAVFFTAAGT